MILLLLAILFVLEGYAHALIYSRLGHGALGFDEHILWATQRGILGVVVVASSFMVWTQALELAVIGALQHPFWKLGTYYTVRNKLDGSYPKGWKSQSDSTTADTNFSWHERLILFIISLILFIYTLL